jgi:hypothetical protein
LAKAASELGDTHPLGTLPYREGASPVLESLKHPNLLAGGQYTVFVPTVEALQTSGVTEPDFVQVAGALDHIIKGHVAEQEVCVGGQVPAVPVQTLADDSFCASDGKVTMVSSAPNSIKVIASNSQAEAATTDIKNIAVCGGLVHVVDKVLLPCPVEDYTSGTQVETGQADRSTDETTVAGQTDGAAALASGAAAVLLL